MIVLEQRKSRRFDLTLPLELLRNGPRRVPVTGETMNLSSSGVLFRSGAQLEPGDIVEYLITFPTSSRNVELRLRCRGKVVRRDNPTDIAATLDRWEFMRDQP